MTQKKTSKEIEGAGAKANDDKLKSKEPKKKDKAEDGKERDSGTKEKNAKMPQPLKERVSYDSEKTNLKKEILQMEKIENSNTNLAPIAIVLSIIALLVSIMFAVSSRSVTPDAGTPGKQQSQSTGKLDSSLAFISSRIDKIEGKITEFGLDKKMKMGERGIIEVKKALLNLQEARSLINDDEMVNKILKIEEDLKSTLPLPEEKETGDELTTRMDENPVSAEKESEEIIVEPEIWNVEEGEKTSKTEIVEPAANIAESEGEQEETLPKTEENQTEL